MKKGMVAFCDLEESYRKQFMSYLEQKKELPFDVMAFSNIEELKEFCRKDAPECIVVSEAVYEEDLKTLGEVIVLNESGFISDNDTRYVDKYQSAEYILKEVFVYVTERINRGMPISLRQKQSKLIGIYSPLKRCLQTSTALAMGQILAKDKKVLYISFEHYCALGRLMEQEFSMNLVDLVYYMKHAKERLIYRLRAMIQTINGLDYIPPAVSFLDLNEIPTEDWMELFEEIGRNAGYDYIILDLHESVTGIFDILQYCDYIYTIEKNDGMAYAKVRQYEELLLKKEYGDILDKTKKVHLPYFRHLPLQVEQLLYSELADYVKALIREEGL